MKLVIDLQYPFSFIQVQNGAADSVGKGNAVGRVEREELIVSLFNSAIILSEISLSLE